MNKEDEKYYNNYFDLFLTEGWKQFVQDANDSLEGLKRELPEIPKTELELGEYRGKYQNIVAILNFQNFIETAYEQILEQEKEETNDNL